MGQTGQAIHGCIVGHAMSIGRLDSADRVRSRGSLAALLAAGLTAAVDLFYVLLIGAQSDTGGMDSRVVFVAGCLGAAAVCAAIGAVLDDGPVRVVLLAVAAFTLFIWTLLGIFSIGILLLAPAILALLATGRAASEVRRASGPALVGCTALAVLAIVALGLMNT
jgi:hypothetical protein